VDWINLAQDTGQCAASCEHGNEMYGAFWELKVRLPVFRNRIKFGERSEKRDTKTST
jgi:hypothetical protein